MDSKAQEAKIAALSNQIKQLTDVNAQRSEHIKSLNKELATHRVVHAPNPPSERQKPKKEKKKSVVTNKIRAPKGMGVSSALAARGQVAPGDDVERLNSDLKYWMKSLADPTRYPEPFCNVGFNPVPSIFKTTAHTFKTLLQFNVAAGTQTNFFIYPGHGPSKFFFASTPGAGQPVPSQMDAVAFHGMTQSINSSQYTIGPIVTAGIPCCGGLYQENVIVGDIAADNTNLVSYKPITYDNPLPYSTGNPEPNGSHVRWQQTSFRFKAVNVTPAYNRGGSVITVMPTNGDRLPTGTGAVLQMAKFPSFHDHGPSMKASGCGVTWLPRPQDIAFWHTINSANVAANNDVSSIGLCVFLTAPVGNAQTFDLELDWNWQLSGTFVEGISTPSATRNEHLQPIATSVQLMQTGAKSAAGFEQVHAAVVENDWKASAAHVFNVAKSVIKEGYKSL